MVLAVLGLSAAAERVYRQMLAEPEAGVATLARHLGMTDDEVRSGLGDLFELALVRQSADRPGRLHAVNPNAGLRAALMRQHADLARRQYEVAQSQAALEQLIDDFGSPGGHPEGSVRTLDGMDAVQDRLEELSRDVRSEVMTFMPGGAQSASSLAYARCHDTRLLARGVRIRTIGLDGVRNDPVTLDYAQFLTAGGAEFRTSPVLPPRMILVDRRTGLLPIDPEATGKGAVELTGPGLVAAMCSLFEQVWNIGTPLGAAARTDRDGLVPQERALLRLLAGGLTDEAAATRLNISHRTARRLMAALMERLGARSRFEAGLKAAQRGWL
jgi:DNA-binding CsgD family transcriptional regulator/sugar-specific transcriptional regulator TrmB